MRSEGMSTRAIGSALGTSEGTVRNDLAGAQDYAPAPVTGTDGKTYAPRQPEPEVVEAELVEDGSGLTDEPGRITKLTGPQSVSSPVERPAPAIRTAEDYRRDNAERPGTAGRPGRRRFPRPLPTFRSG